jgi:uncharacterized protein YkwD
VPSIACRRWRRAKRSRTPPIVTRAVSPRARLDHAGFRQRVPPTSGTAAENVAFGCATEDCVIRMWVKSGRHRANMLRRNVTSYGIASAVTGRRYWVLELGN